MNAVVSRSLQLNFATRHTLEEDQLQMSHTGATWDV